MSNYIATNCQVCGEASDDLRLCELCGRQTCPFCVAGRMGDSCRDVYCDECCDSNAAERGREAGE